LATLVWGATIFSFSTRAYESSVTAWVLHQALDLLHVHISSYAFAILHTLIRKLAHLTEYAIFGLLLYGCLNRGRSSVWRVRTALWCIAIAAAYSLTDEFHQWFVPGRGPSLIDCGIDALGASLGMLVLYARSRFFAPPKDNSTAATSERPAET
jgi:VanZ family protein